MSKPYSHIKVLIADDHEMVRSGLLVMSKKIDEFEIIGEAENGEELIQLTKKLQPDVILTDIKMPKLDGVEATRKIKEELPHIGVIALTSFDEESLILDMLNAGAQGYLLKNAGKQELTAAVKAASNNEPYYSREIYQKLAHLITHGSTISRSKKAEDLFTPRELQVIEEICKGYPSKQIADHLGLKTRTVERYRDTIMEKMGVHNAAGVVAYALSKGIYTPTGKQ